MDDFTLAPEPRPDRGRGRALLIALVAVALFVGAVFAYRAMLTDPDDAAARARAEAGADSGKLPSIVVIVTDDQRWDTLDAMPIVQSELADHGVTFRNGFVVNSACCPSRASILTGKYSHSTGVYTNTGSEGGFRSFNDGSTMATWLDVDYESALIGKYLNNYEFAGKNGQVPLGWDHWVAFPKAAYGDFALNIDGKVERFGGHQGSSTSVLADQAVRFIEGTDGPLLLYFAPKAPHWPAEPEPRDADEFSHIAKHRPRSFNEADVSDKPDWVQRKDLLTSAQVKAMDRFRRGQLQTLLPVDRAVGDVVAALDDTGRLGNTMIVFLSDNGMLWGEHRLRGKGNAYEESIRVPFIVRYDAGVADPGSASDELVLNIDIAPTAAALGGVNAPRAEGKSLLPLLLDPDASWREDFLVEHFSPGGPSGNPPVFCAVRSERYKLVDYYWGRDELYDLNSDPYELENRIFDPALAAERNHLQAREKELCNPPPPRKLSYWDQR